MNEETLSVRILSELDARIAESREKADIWRKYGSEAHAERGEAMIAAYEIIRQFVLAEEANQS